MRVTPNAGQDRVEGVAIRDDGTAVLRLRVTAVPDKGRANVAVIVLLAKLLGVPKSSISVANGETARLKTIAVAASGAALAAAIATLAALTVSSGP